MNIKIYICIELKIKIMKYMGSKNRIAKHLLPIMLENRNGRTWVEPFVGGANMISKVEGMRIGADFNEYLICLLSELQNGWQPIREVNIDLFKSIRENPNDYQKHEVAYIEFLLTFGAVWGRGFVGSVNDIVCKGRDRIGEGYRNALKTQKEINGIEFIHSSYQFLEIPSNSLIYCDPPYEGTTKYKANETEFNHLEFWDWCREKTKQGHKVYISECNAPDDFVCVWEKETVVNFNNSSFKRIEKLYVYK